MAGESKHGTQLGPFLPGEDCSWFGCRFFLCRFFLLTKGRL